MVYFVPTEHLETPLPYIEWTGEEFLLDGEYSILEIDESKSVSVNSSLGLVYVVERADRPGKQFASLNYITRFIKVRTPARTQNRTKRREISREGFFGVLFAQVDELFARRTRHSPEFRHLISSGRVYIEWLNVRYGKPRQIRCGPKTADKSQAANRSRDKGQGNRDARGEKSR
jgi:hypothetical protein